MANKEAMTHYLSICNGLALLIRYNESEDMIEYRYSNEDEVKTANVIYGSEGSPFFFTDEDGMFSLEQFCKINI